MSKPVVGVIGNLRVVETRFAVQQVGEKYLHALAEVAGAMPLMSAGAPQVADITTFLDTVDGVVLTGGQANVHPTHFDAEPHEAYEPYDENRDLPRRMNHRMPQLANGEIYPDPEVIFADRHDVSLIRDGAFARIYGKEMIPLNSLHGQGVLEPGERVIIEGMAQDGTVEAINISPDIPQLERFHIER